MSFGDDTLDPQNSKDLLQKKALLNAHNALIKLTWRHSSECSCTYCDSKALTLDALKSYNDPRLLALVNNKS